MRTTIEIDDGHRAKLLEIAAQRGEKGFSRIIGEALVLYLKSQVSDAERRQRAILLRGALGAREAQQLRSKAAKIRESWR